MNGFKDGVLETLIIKNIKLPAKEMSNSANMELRLLKALSNPIKNAQMYKSVKHLEVSFNNCN